MTISTRRLRLLRGNSSAISGFTGLQGELVFNTDTYTLHLQDGATAGGFSLATSAELANITANANYGNSNVSSYLASNSNVTILTTANITGNYIFGNGSQLTGIAAASNFGNANVVANLAALGNNPVVTTANITANFFIGNGSQLTGLPATYSNTNVVSLLSSFGSNTIATTGNISAANLIATTRTYANTAIFGYGTDGSGLVGAPVYISGNSTQSLIGTNGIAGNVASNLTVKTLNSNISLQITGADKTWVFDTAGNLTAPGTILGNLRTSETTIALGYHAGSSGQGALTVAVGNQAGEIDQGLQSTAVGSGAGNYAQGIGAVAVGTNAGAVNQGLRAVAIGGLAGSQNQGAYAVAVGNFAGGSDQANNSIILSATGTGWSASSSGFFVAPVATNTTGNVLYYNTTTNEITYGSVGSINSIANGTSNVSIPVANGAVTVTTAGANTWTFDSNGAINLANHGVIRRQDSVNLVGNGYVQMQWIDTGNLNIADPNGTSGPTNWMWVDQTGLHIETNVNSGGTSYAWEFLNTGNIGATGNIRLVTNDNLWNFDTNGSLTFPGNTLQIGLVGGNSGIRSDSANIVIDTTAAGGGQWNFISNGKLQSPNGGLIGAVDTNDVNSFGLKAGGSVNYVELNYGDDQRIYVDSAGSYIGTNNQSSQYLWSFRDDGWLTLPGSLSAAGNITGVNVVSANTFVSNAFNVVTAGNLLITSQYGLGFTGTILEDNGTLELIANGAGGVVVGWDSTYGNGLGNIATVNFNEVGGGEGNILLRTGNRSATEYNWIFDKLGTLTLPGSLSTPSNVTVNDTLFVVGSIQPTGASPAPYLSGFSSISTVISGNANEGNITAHNYLRANGGIITTGNITGGNLSISGNMTGNTAGFVIGYRDIPQVVFTSNATLALTDAGKHYYSANSANIITVPNNATVSFNIGTAISIVQQGTANLTVTPASGVTMYLAGNSTSASRTLGNYGMATLMKVATDTWFINGTGLT